jgi:hypothetical protein
VANANPWDSVFDRVKVVREPNEVPAPLPTDEQVAVVEKELGHRLPSSYRAFAQRFGLHGECVGVYLLPLSNPKTPTKTLVQHTLSCRKRIIDYARTMPGWGTHDSRIERVVFFTSGGSTFYGWDPTAPTDSAGHEFRIYEHPVPEPRLEPGPSSFWELLESRANYRAERDHRLAGSSTSEVAPGAGLSPIVFQPYIIRKKLRPTSEDLATIKKWDNGTIVQLARTIRENNQLGVLPVLADALEEAGCANADMIDSCRSRFPDIDGEWVLHVLGVRKRKAT